MIDMTCPVCGKPYQANPSRLKFGRETTCSRLCSYTLRSHGLKKLETKHCAVCKVPVTRSPSQNKSEFWFCSPRCHYKARSKGLVKRHV